MIIVKRKAEILRLGLFLVLMGLMAYFVMTTAESFQDASGKTAGRSGTGATVAGAQVGTDMGAAAAGTAGKKATAPVSGAGAAAAGQGPKAGDLALDGREYFAEARLMRDQGRSLRKQELQALIDNPNVDAEVRKAASLDLQAVLKYASLETQAEALVRGRGIDEVLVTMTDEGAIVQVKAEERSQNLALQVADAVATVTGLKLHAVRVQFQSTPPTY